jgi:hypothetical protein
MLKLSFDTKLVWFGWGKVLKKVVAFWRSWSRAHLQIFCRRRWKVGGARSSTFVINTDKRCTTFSDLRPRHFFVIKPGPVLLRIRLLRIGHLRTKFRQLRIRRLRIDNCGSDFCGLTLADQTFADWVFIFFITLPKNPNINPINIT